MNNPTDLISKKEVEKMIDEMIERGKGNNDILRYGNTVLRNLKKELSQIESVNGWIAVTERLPEKNGDYIVFTGEVKQARYKDGDWYAGWIVTHYMPLPPPPIINKV